MKNTQKLYKIDTKGKTRVWWMEYDNEKYRTHSGIDDGKIVVSGWQYPEAKNVGRYSCNCTAYGYRQRCSHIDGVKHGK